MHYRIKLDNKADLLTAKDIEDQIIKLLKHKMADYNIELTFTVVPEFKGGQEELIPFLKIVKILYDTLKTEAKKTFLDFIVNVKLNTLLRTALGGTEINTLQTLEEKLTDRYKSNRTLAQVQFQLSKVHQYNESIRAYSDKISKLIDQLNEIQIRDLKIINEDQKNNFRRANELYSLNIFKQGLNDNFSSIIFAAQPKTFNEALNLAFKIETQVVKSHLLQNTEQI